MKKKSKKATSKKVTSNKSKINKKILADDLLIKEVLDKSINIKSRFFPNLFNEVYILDGGNRSGGFFVIDIINQKHFWLSASDFVLFPAEHKNALIVLEHAHFCERKKSKAQILSEEQRIKFLSNCASNGVTFKLFPELQTPKARSYAAEWFDNRLLKKSELNDTLSIFLYLNFFHKDIFSVLQGGASVIKNGKIVILGKSLLQINNEVLQHARSTDYLDCEDVIYKYAKKYKQDVSNIIENFCKNKNLDDHYCQSVNEFFDLQGPKSKCVSKVVYTIISTLINNDGTPLKGEGANLLGWKFVRDRIFCFNPNRGGIAKSNINHHRIRSRLGKKSKEDKEGKPYKPYHILALKSLQSGERISKLTEEDYNKFIEQRKLWRLCIKELFAFFKRTIQLDLLKNVVYQDNSF